jgi:hypothetical protein
MHRRPTSTMSDSFFTHGLAGIDVHHAEIQRAQDAASEPRQTQPSRLRQAIATVFIAAGTVLAGSHQVRPAGERVPA